MPLIAIIDWEASPLDDTDGAVERDVTGDAARVKRFLCSEAATPNLIVTCHAAFYNVESKNEMRATSARIALAAINGLPLENVVNNAEVNLSKAVGSR